MINPPAPDEGFRPDLVRALAPDLAMYRWRASPDGLLVLFAGLWSTWWVNEENCVAKFVLATVPSRAALPSTTRLEALPWVILQLQAMDQESPAWAELCDTLQAEFRSARVDPLRRDRSLSASSHPRPRCANSGTSLTFDPTQETHAVRRWAQADLLDAVTVRLVDGGDGGGGPPPGAARPTDIPSRTRVEYAVDGIPDVRLFVEKATARQPIRRRMQEAAGLKRQGSLLAAANEWCTWFVLTGSAAATPVRPP